VTAQPSESEKLEDWITTTEAGRLLGVTARRVRQLIDEEELVAIRLNPRMMLVSRLSVEKYQRKK